MHYLTAIVLLLALYGLLALLTNLVPSPRNSERFGGVVCAGEDRGLGYAPPELRAKEHAIRGALASAITNREPT